MKLNLEICGASEPTIVECRGGIVYRDEAAALTCLVTEILGQKDQVLLDLRAIDAVDSAGLGQLVFLHLWALGRGKTLKLAGVNSRVRRLIELTNLASVFALHPTLADALEGQKVGSLA